MKSTRPILARSIATALSTVLVTGSLYAQSGTWTNTASSVWPTATNWAGSVIANGTDSIADFSTLNITAANTVSLNGARTIGGLKFGDTTASHDWTLAPGTPVGALTLDVSSGQPTINIVNRTATITTVLAGNDGLAVTGNASGASGTLVLNAVNTFTGGLTVGGAVVQLNNASAAGGNLITVAASTNTASANRLAINAGVTISNNIVVESGASPLAGNGTVQAVGTGSGTVNGTVTILGNAANGGHFAGQAGSELVLNGAVTFTGGNVVHRVGRVTYRGGGDYGSISITGVATVGADNGIAPNAGIILQAIDGVATTLALGSFNQATTGLTFTGVSTAGQSTVSATTGVLTLNGNFTSGGNFSHQWGGNVNLGGEIRTFTVNDGTTEIDVNATANFTNGGILKQGSGTIALNGAVAVPTSIDNGTLAGTGNFSAGLVMQPFTTLLPGSLHSVGTITANQLTFGAGSTTLQMEAGTGGDLISAGTVVNQGITTVNLNQFGGALPVGVYPLISYTGTSPGVGTFALTPFGHATATLVDTGSAIAVNVTANDRLVWTGALDGTWDTFSQNWKLLSNNSPASYVEADDVIFGDLATLDNPLLVFGNVAPSLVTFSNTTASNYAFSGSGGIIGTAAVNKTGNGTVVLQMPNSYSGATTVTAGTLELDHDTTGNVVLTGTSGVSLATGTTLRLTRDDGGFTFNRNILGTGTVEVNPRTVGAGTTSLSVFLSGDNTGFTGTLRLPSPAAGTYRIQSPTPTNLGGATIVVQDGAQILTAANQVYTNDISITGNGFTDTFANVGALRLEGGSNWAGDVNVVGNARIGVHNATATVSGSITGGDLSVNVSNANNNYTLIFTGANSYGATVIGGQNTQTAGVPSYRLNVGNGGTTGTLGAGPVTINGDGANGVLGFDRADGYTLLAGQTITGGGTNLTRTFIDVDTRGTGLNTNGNAITLGVPTAGGQIRVGQARAGSILNANSNLTAGTFTVGSGQFGTANLNTGANLNVGAIRVATAAVATGSVLNINAGSTVSALTLFVGEVASGGGVVNQAADSTVTVANQLRVGHFGTETSVYNMAGGTVTLTGDSPLLTPSTSGAGAANATGDNNINALATPAVVGGGIYLGIDGTGIFNQSGGTVSTNWIVLDNRGDTGAGTNMATGVDQYNLSAGTLAVKSSYGIIQRNNSAEFNFSGGTIRVDNTGTGTGTGANLTVPLDAVLKVAGTTATLDTNGAGNGFVLSRNILGTGTLNVTGGGSFVLNPSVGGGNGNQIVSANLASSSPVNKAGAGTTSFTRPQTYTTPTTVSAGRLNLPSAMATSSLTVQDGAGISGEPTIASVTLGSVTGSNLFIDPNTPAALTTTDLTVNGATSVDLALGLATGGTATGIPVLRYTNKVGAGNFVLANAANYRPGTALSDNGSLVSLDLVRKNLTWVGTTGAWDVNNTANWTDGVSPEKFFAADTVTFDETGTTTAVTLTGVINPSKVTVNSDTKNYTLTGVISGGASIEKSGASTLTLAGANTYAGPTNLKGGNTIIAASNNLGNGSPTNTLTLDGGQLTATASVDLGVTRSIFVGPDGGTLSASGTAALTISIPGDTSGSGVLTLTSGATAAPTFVLSGKSQLDGGVNVNSIGATSGATTLRLDSPEAITAGVIDLAAATVNNGATTLRLSGQTLPSAVTVSLNSLQSGTNSFRSQIVSEASGSAIDGPTILTGSAISQMSTSAVNGLTFNGPVSAGTGGFTGTFFLRGSTGSGTVNGVINLPNGFVSKTDGNTWTINSTGGSWVETRVVVGTLVMGANGVLPATSSLLLGQNDTNAASLNLNGFNQTITSLTSNPTTVGANTTGKTITSATPATLTINQDLNTTYAGLIAGSTSVVKAGFGTLTLAGASTHTGTTVVNGGSLIVSGSLAGSAVTVNSGAILAGGGAVDSLQVLDGILEPGTNTTGTLTVEGALSLNSGALIKFELAQSGVAGGGINDFIAGGGALTLDGTLQVTELAGFGLGVYPLFSYAGGLPALTNNGLTIDPFFLAAYPGSFIDTSLADQVSLVVVPEPGSVASLAIGLGALLGLQRFRRQRL
jgi:fibronectin-binding autotransporter adhesin